MSVDDGLVSLANLKGGAVIEAADCALQEVFENILDPNTEATQTREVTVKLIFKPGKERKTSAILVKVDRKLAAQAPFDTTIAIGKGLEGKAVGSEFGELNPGQHILPDTVEDPTRAFAGSKNVTPFKSAANGAN